MYCQNCGNALEDDARFCPSCGKPAGTSSQTTAPVNQQPIIVNVINKNENTNQNCGGRAVSPKSRMAAGILCFFFGIIGFHRFYVGKIGTGIIYLLTGGLFGIGALIDFLSILFGSFKDGNGLPLQ